jgi:hypothetical protein
MLTFTQYIADSDNPTTYPPPALIDWPLDPASLGLQPEAVILAAGFKPDDNPGPQFGRLKNWWRKHWPGCIVVALKKDIHEVGRFAISASPPEKPASN